ncbi:MAG: 1-acyl-sn-glycerol-3-phosphate acyltransferase [Nitriliruptor sp.]|nr:MAG: 1-acyl-sn-glycerol-3-phosphate acyltransferase [Nitriliruptor sp.]
MDDTGPKQLNWRWRVIAAVIILVVRVLRWRIDVRGLEHVPARGGAVLAFNHHSYVDFMMVGWPIIRQRRRPMRFLAKREIWSSRKVGWAARWAEAIPVDRGSDSARDAAFEAATQALQAGDLIAVAPEQTISPSFELLPLRTGAARMAQQAGVPIVPVAGWGSHRALTKGGPRRLVRKLPVTVRFGDPLQVGPEDDVVEVTAELTRRLTRLLHEAQDTYPDGAPPGARWVPARLGGGAPDHAEVLREHTERERRWTGSDPLSADSEDPEPLGGGAAPA